MDLFSSHTHGGLYRREPKWTSDTRVRSSCLDDDVKVMGPNSGET